MQVRHLLVGAWYPLLPYTRDPNQWMASQYHRPDLDEGIILAFRRPESPHYTVQLSLHGLKPNAIYKLSFDSTGRKLRYKGKDLMGSFLLTIPARHGSELIHYKRVSLK